MHRGIVYLAQQAKALDLDPLAGVEGDEEELGSPVETRGGGVTSR